MIIVSIICTVLLSLTGVLCLIRITRGPTMLDRTVASDVFVAASIGTLAIDAAVRQYTTTLPALVSLSFIAFIGSVAIARYTKPDSAHEETSGEEDAF
ncbi:MAG: hypothetical protein E6Q27_02205 [Aeromicrobium sp.]|jgi:multicomponent Na+:H+ antiporter subunit F|nr:MAG: hypothetical protein E6Q27_02205 [Aeromicrobium sp.]